MKKTLDVEITLTKKIDIEVGDDNEPDYERLLKEQVHLPHELWRVFKEPYSSSYLEQLKCVHDAMGWECKELKIK